MDPTRRRSGGALLGDRIRMNSLAAENVFMRSLATRRQNLATSAVLKDTIGLLQLASFDLIMVETAGIGQSDSEIADVVDQSLYVMTSEYGAASQLEKIDMLDFADMIVLNKFEKRGAEDALRDVRKQWRRNHPAARAAPGCAGAGVSDHRQPLQRSRRQSSVRRAVQGARHQGQDGRRSNVAWKPTSVGPTEFVSRDPLIPGTRTRYLAEIAANGRRRTAGCGSARWKPPARAYGLYESLRALHDAPLPAPLERYPESALNDPQADATRRELRAAYNRALDAIGAEGVGELKRWPQRVQGDHAGAVLIQGARPHRHWRELHADADRHVRSRSSRRRRRRSGARSCSFILTENLPGSYPYTGGVYPYRREEEDPIRMFAGEGGPEQTNRRFHYLASGHGATRLSTAFDSTTLYGEDPDTRPDIYGRTGNSGVSIATLDDMKKLYSGFDLCAPMTSVSMTINGPAPMILAMFMNAAIDQRVERFLRAEGRWDGGREAHRRHCTRRIRARGGAVPTYRGELPKGHDGSGLALLGIIRRGTGCARRAVAGGVRAHQR